MNQTAQTSTALTSVGTFLAALSIEEVNQYLSAASFCVSILVGLTFVYFKAKEAKNDKK